GGHDTPGRPAEWPGLAERDDPRAVLPRGVAGGVPRAAGGVGNQGSRRDAGFRRRASGNQEFRRLGGFGAVEISTWPPGSTQ
ncbi:hypothetical protein B4Q13_18125, partial [Lacticaseibacillus rhamnosus]